MLFTPKTLEKIVSGDLLASSNRLQHLGNLRESLSSSLAAANSSHGVSGQTAASKPVKEGL